MKVERIREVYNDFKEALSRLKEAFEEDLSKGSIIVDGTIKRFEFTFELARKLANLILGYNNIEARGPRATIKEAFALRLIKDGDNWIDMLEDGNKTSHIYDEKQALKIYRKIKDTHFSLLKDFLSSAERFIQDNA